MRWAGALVLLLVASPAFSMSAGLSDALGELKPMAMTIGGMILAAYAAMGAIKLLYINFLHEDAVADIDNFTDLDMTTSRWEWWQLSQGVKEVGGSVHSSSSSDVFGEETADSPGSFSDFPEIDYEFDKETA